MLDLILTRFAMTPTFTLGTISSRSEVLCFTLEDTDRLRLDLPKLPKKTAIPAGTYPVHMTPSARFGRITPHLMDVPGFSFIRIHPGNTDKDTEGCILPGRGADLFLGMVRDSAKAYQELFSMIDNAGGLAQITIIGAPLDGVYSARLRAALLKDYEPKEA
jgi:hypothetical protein